MKITDGVAIQVERKGAQALLSMQAGSFRTVSGITLPQLEAVIAEFSQEATAWRKRIAENLYTVLGVSQTATPEEIQKAYRTMQKRFHPDAKGGSTERSQTINAAYETLSDPKRRNVYDQTL